jgi:hypothetical protein
MLARVSMEKYKALGEFHAELATHEGALDALLKRIRGDGLDPSVPLDGLHACTKALRRGCALHLDAEYPRDDSESLRDAASIVSEASDVIGSQGQRLCKLYEPSLAVDSSFGPLIGRLTESINLAASLKQSARKVA